MARTVLASIIIVKFLKVAGEEQILYLLNTGSAARDLALPAWSFAPQGPELVNLLTGERISPVEGRYHLSLAAVSGSFWQLADQG